MKQALKLALLTAGGLLVSLLTQGYLLVVVGPGAQTDALYAGLVLPQTVGLILSGALTNVLVPLLAGEDVARRRRDLWTLIAVMGVPLAALAVALGASAPLWIRALVPGFAGDARALAVLTTRIQLALLVLTPVSSVLLAVQQARGRFVYSEIVQFFTQASALVALVLTLRSRGVVAAAWINVLRVVLVTVLLLPGVGLARPQFGERSFLLEVWRRAKPLLLGGAYYKCELLVDALLSSLAPAGALSLLYLAQRLYAGMGELVRRAVAAPAIPLLAERAKAGDRHGFMRIFRARLLTLLAAACAIYLATVAAGSPVLRALVGHGGVTPENAGTFWWILVALGGYLVGGSAGVIISGSWYALGNTRLPTVVGTLGFTAGILLKVAGLLQFGVLGIALATTLYYVANALVLYALQVRKP